MSNTVQPPRGRLRAYARFIAAVLFFFLARTVAQHWAQALVNERWSPLVSQALLALLLLLGYAGFGITFDRQTHPIGTQGFPLRAGWRGEAGLGLAMGWALAVVCVLPLTIVGGIAIVLSTHASAWGWLVADAVFFALLALVEEMAFRGYGFQRFADAVGSVGAAIGFAAFYAIVQALQPGTSRTSIAVSIMLSLLLSTAYLRTKALWLSWGLNFAWKASRALIFGLAVSGISSHSSVVEGDPMGPFWLTGGGFGLDGSWLAFFVLLAALPAVYRATRDLDYRYNAPVFVPGGIAVDLDAAARQQHEAATRPAEPQAPVLVQILPAAAPAPASRSEQPPPSSDNDSH